MRPDEFFSRTVPAKLLSARSVRFLDSFVRILNTRSAIGHSHELTAVHSTHVYEVRPRKDKRGVDLISDVLPFGRLRYGQAGCDQLRKVFQPITMMIRVYDDAGNVIETREHKVDFKEW